jgi:hypothetical protein
MATPTVPTSAGLISLCGSFLFDLRNEKTLSRL